MITANKIKIEGNSIFIRSNPTIGIIALTSFVDNTAGEDSTHSFTKSFRYSKNGIIFSEWHELTPVNILSISVNAKDTLIIELNYIKHQPAGDDNLTITSASIGTTATAGVNGFYFDNSIFKQYFNSDDLEVLNWQISVLSKLFERGLLPSYIDRFDEFGSPDDFIEFWRAVTKYFAYYVVYARKYQKFYQSEVLLQEYIEQRGMKTSPLNTIIELNYLMKNFYKEIFHRGTVHIVDKASQGAAIDGELLRLIKYNPLVDEFIFNLYKPEHFGWNLGNSSPCYRGMRINDNANKYYEQQAEPSDITKYPISGAAFAKVVDGGRDVIEIVNGGICVTGLSNPNLFKIKVDEFMDYELFFMVKLSAGAKLHVGYAAYNKAGGSMPLKSQKDSSSTLDHFAGGVELQRADKYLGVSLFLYNKLKPPFAGDTTTLNAGIDLRLIDGVTHVIPNIECSGGTMQIYNIRFVPMRTSYSRGFLDTKNFISAWIKNNNNDIDILGIKQFIKRYLIPYNSNIELSTIVNDGDYTQEVIPV